MGKINNEIKNDAEQINKEDITKRFVSESELTKEEAFSREIVFEDDNYEHEHRSRTVKRKKRRRHTSSFKNHNFTPLLTVFSLVVLVIVVAIVWFYNQNYIKRVYTELGKTFETSLSGADSDDDTTWNKKDTSELFSIEEPDYDSGIEFPLSNVYDGNGNLAVEVIKSSDGTVEKAIYNTYENGNLTVRKEYSADAKLVCITEYTENGKRLYETVSDTSGYFNGYTVTEYDGSDKMVKVSTFTYGGVLSGYGVYEYGETGLLERIDNYSAYDTALSYVVYEYDEAGKNIGRSSYDQDNKLEYVEKCTYDEENRLIEEKKYINDVCRSYTEYIYDEYGNAELHVYYLIDEDKMIYKEVTKN